MMLTPRPTHLVLNQGVSIGPLLSETLQPKKVSSHEWIKTLPVFARSMIQIHCACEGGNILNDVIFVCSIHNCNQGESRLAACKGTMYTN